MSAQTIGFAASLWSVSAARARFRAAFSHAAAPARKSNCRRSGCPDQSCGRGTGRPAPSAIAPSPQSIVVLRPGEFSHADGAAAIIRAAWAAGCSTSPMCCCRSPRCSGRAIPFSAAFFAGHVPPVTLAFIRWGGAALILLPFAAATSPARLADDPKHCRPADADRVYGLLRLQHDGLLRPAIHHGDQRAAAAIGRAVVRGDVDLRAVRRPADASASRRHLHLANRRLRHRLPRQPRSAARDRLQSWRPLFPVCTRDLRILCGLPAQAAGDASVLVPRRGHGLGRGDADAGGGRGDRQRPDHGIRRRELGELRSSFASFRRCSAICSSTAASI